MGNDYCSELGKKAQQRDIIHFFLFCFALHPSHNFPARSFFIIGQLANSACCYLSQSKVLDGSSNLSLNRALNFKLEMSHDAFQFKNEFYATGAFNQNSFNIFKVPSRHKKAGV